MSEFVNKDYTLPGLSAASCLMSGAEGLGFGISAHCESPLVGNYALKPLWPDKNLTGLYLSVKLFFLFSEDRYGLKSESFCPP